MAGILIVDQIQNSSNTLLINSGALAGNTVGTAQLQSGITVAANTITANTVTTSGMSLGGVSIGAGDASIMKNRIINGAMVIDQRNAGASVTPADGAYTLDRWKVGISQASKFTVQQNAGSVSLPAGFTNYLGVTSSSAYSVGSGDYFGLRHCIEGYNVADLGWGSASAKTVTLSFQVYSSLTGTFGGVLQNSAQNRSYPFTYTVSSANTWTSISVTIAGDTTGTWLTTNGIGMYVIFGLGVGSTYSGTAGSWAGSLYLSATGATSVVGTSGATFYITGVQLEVGSSATGFEYVNYQTSLANCQRYFCSSFNIGTAPAQNIGGGMIGKGANGATAEPILTWSFPVAMRTSPTVTTYNPSAANNQWSAGSSPRVVTGTTAYVSVDNTGTAVTAGTQSYISLSATAEL